MQSAFVKGFSRTLLSTLSCMLRATRNWCTIDAYFLTDCIYTRVFTKIYISMKNGHVRYLKVVLLPAVFLNILICCVAVLVFGPEPAFAHAYVIGSDPVDGSTVTTVPKVVHIFFNANISSMSVAQVAFVQNGNLVTLTTHSELAPNNTRELDTYLPANITGGSYLVRWTAVANEDGHTTFGSIGFNVGRSSTGLVGTVKLGPTSSNCVGDICVQDIRKLDMLGILSVAWEWLSVAALTLWIGILVVERLVFVRVEHVTDLLERARQRAQPLQWLCLSALLVGDVVTLALRSIRVTNGIRVTRALNNDVFDFSALPSLLTGTEYGRLWMMRCILIILSLVLLWWTTRPRSERETEHTQQPIPVPTRTGPLHLQQASGITATTGSLKAIRSTVPVTAFLEMQRFNSVWFLLAGLIVGTYALAENTISTVQPHVSAVVLTGLLFVAQGVWFGGLGYLGYVMLPLLSVVDLDSNTQTLLGFLRCIRPFILVAIGIELVSLLFLTETTISAQHLFLDDPYGRSLLVRLGLVGLALLVSSYIVLVLCPKLTRQTLLVPVVDADLPVRRNRQSAVERTMRHLRFLLGTQSLLAAGVLLCAALMAFYAPPIVYPDVSYANPPATATGTPGTDTTQQQKVGEFTVGLQVQPGRVTSANTVIVSIVDAKGKAVTNAKVEVITNMQGMDMGTAIQKATTQGTTYVTTFAQGQAFSMSGLWDIGIRFQLPGQAVQKATFQVTAGIDG